MVLYVTPSRRATAIASVREDKKRQEAAALAKSFAASWRAAIAAANADVLRLFANFVNGVEVLKQVLTQLLLYYTRFQEIVRKNGGGDVPFAGDFVPTATILDEIKKYSRIF